MIVCEILDEGFSYMLMILFVIIFWVVVGCIGYDGDRIMDVRDFMVKVGKLKRVLGMEESFVDLLYVEDDMFVKMDM